MEFDKIKNATAMKVVDKEGIELSGQKKIDAVLSVLNIHCINYDDNADEDTKKFALSSIARDLSELAKETQHEIAPVKLVSVKEISSRVSKLKAIKELNLCTGEEFSKDLSDIITDSVKMLESVDDGFLEEYVQSWDDDDLGLSKN